MTEFLKSPPVRLAAALSAVALLASGCGTKTETQTMPVEPAPATSLIPSYPVGYDISWAQCGKPLPASGAFAIIQITHGRPDQMNECLADQATWADTTMTSTANQPKKALYLWPANPGKNYRGQVIKSWPTKGLNIFGKCIGSSGQACSFEYGLMRGRQAMQYAKAALRTTNSGTVYIDVESGVGDEPGTWQDNDFHANLAAIDGYVAAIQETGSIAGIYSNPAHLSTVLTPQDAQKLVSLPEWTAGATSLDEAKSSCNTPFIPGAKVVLAQYLDDPAIDHDYAC